MVVASNCYTRLGSCGGLCTSTNPVITVTTNEVLLDEGRLEIEIRKCFDEMKLQSMETGTNTDSIDITN
jgi:hypothetical protein